MAIIDFNDNIVSDEESKQNLQESLNRFFPPEQPNAQELIESSNNDEQLSASEVLDIAGRDVKFRVPSILTRAKEITKGIFFSRDAAKLKKMAKTPTYKLARMKIRSIEEKKVPKFLYYRRYGKVYRKPNEEWERRNYRIDSSGRPIGGKSGAPRSRGQKVGYNLLKSILPLDSEAVTLRQMELAKYKAYQKMAGYSAGMQSAANRFNQRLMAEEAIYRQIAEKRNNATMPPGFVQSRVLLRQKQIREASEHARANSLLRAHEGNLTPSQNKCIDLFDNSILKTDASNNIMLQRPDSINLLKSNRLKILQTKEVRNSIQF